MGVGIELLKARHYVTKIDFIVPFVILFMH